MTDAQFGEIIQQYERLIYTICYQFTKNHHTAEDLTQDTFVSAYLHKDTCPEDNMKPWLARIATNKAKDHLKSAYNRKISAVDKDDMPDDKGALFITSEQPEDITISKEQTQKIENDIRELKEPYNKVAIMYFIENKSVEEISAKLERPTKTVHTQLYRAKNILREKLGKEGW